MQYQLFRSMHTCPSLFPDFITISGTSFAYMYKIYKWKNVKFAGIVKTLI